MPEQATRKKRPFDHGSNSGTVDKYRFRFPCYRKLWSAEFGAAGYKAEIAQVILLPSLHALTICKIRWVSRTGASRGN